MPKKRSTDIDVAERMVPEFHKGNSIYGEHYVRYKAATPLAANKTVLDIASGSGYGTQLLAKNAKKVYGVDVAKDAVEYAKQNFSGDNIEYLVGDGESIPLDDNSVDLIVCFETIEHIKNYRKFLKELKRVLKKDGLLILSTPNELEFAEGNHYHLHEFEEDELAGLIKKEFANLKRYYQGDWIYSAVFDKKNMSVESAEPGNIPTLQLSPLKEEKYLYFYFLCSNRKITETVKQLAAISEHWSARQIQEKQQLTDQHIENLSDNLKSVQKHSRALEEAVRHREAYIKIVESKLNNFLISPHYWTGKRLKRAITSLKRKNKSR